MSFLMIICYITIRQPPANVSDFRKAKMKCLKGISSRAFAIKKPSSGRFFNMVPLTGVEPVRILLRGILSPLCLPIPPQRQI